jgi:hypothetical protein
VDLRVSPWGTIGFGSRIVGAGQELFNKNEIGLL